MSYPYHRSLTQKGFTLLELTIVIMVLLALLAIGFSSMGNYNQWKLGRAASESLREVYTAQRMYLADHPTAVVANLTAAELIPYLPNNSTTLPTVKPLKGSDLTIQLTVSPPVLQNGAAVYDPSGSPTDSLWDVGE